MAAPQLRQMLESTRPRRVPELASLPACRAPTSIRAAMASADCAGLEGPVRTGRRRHDVEALGVLGAAPGAVLVLALGRGTRRRGESRLRARPTRPAPAAVASRAIVGKAERGGEHTERRGAKSRRSCLELGQKPNPPAPFPKREGGELSRERLGFSPPSRFGKGVGGLGYSLNSRLRQQNLVARLQGP